VPERILQEQARQAASFRGRLLIASCRAGSYLASKVVARYREYLRGNGSDARVLYLEDIDQQFSDSETCVRLDIHVGGYDVFLFQALSSLLVGSSVDEAYMAFLIAARAFREHGAKHVTAVLPYLAYGRQDKPTRFKREPTTLKLMADLALEAGIDRVVTWEPHSRQVHGFYGCIRVDTLDSLNLFVDEFQRFEGRADVIAVAPDPGASKFVAYFGRALDLNSAVAAKYRPQPEKAVISEVIGDFSGKRIAIVLDDMISSGGTVYALITKLVQETNVREVHLGVSHYLGMEKARHCLLDLHNNYGLKQVTVTDSIPLAEAFKAMPFVRVRCLADVLARIVNRIHYDRSVSELFYPWQATPP
jgi:ribose-phosphate pyrophosphokinase